MDILGIFLSFASIFFVGIFTIFAGRESAAVKSDSGLIVMNLFLAAVFAVLGIFIALNIDTGRPLTNIGDGVYEVEYIIIKSDYVDVGVLHGELPEKETDTRKAVYYRFNQNIFHSEISTDASKLIVERVGDFRRITLK
jgi:hypothetical protein